MPAITEEFLLCALAGFLAQLVDGAVGMAYGVTATSILLAVGVPPVAASATVHTAECFTTGVSAISHQALGNVSRFLFRKLILPGVIGAIIGAYLLTRLPAEKLKPFVAGYLLFMGAVIFLKAFRQFPPRQVTTYLGPLAFFGALLDAMGGGGWGAIIGSNLIVRGNNPREAVGSTNAVEFFVTLASSIVFYLTLGAANWQIILGLALGGVLAAPLGAWVCKRLPAKPFMVFIGALIMLLSARTLYRSLI